MALKAPAVNVENAIEAYVSGENCERAAARFGTSQTRLAKTLKDRGLWRDRESRAAIKSAKLKATSPNRLPAPAAAIIARYVSGESEKSIADALGVSRSVIRRRLIEAGVDARDSTAANRLMMATRTPEENRRNVEAAHRVSHSRPRTFAHKCKSALTRQERQTHVSPAELLLREWLQSRGIDSVPQQAIGPYNADLGAAPVAVEIQGGGWHAHGVHAALAPDRTRYILDQGWLLVFVWVDRRKWRLTTDCADYLVALIEEARRDPSLRGEYRVIRGDGQEVARDRDNLDHVTLVPSYRRSDDARP